MKHRVSILLSETAAEYFGFQSEDHKTVRWQKYFKHASFYRDTRDQSLKDNHRLIEPSQETGEKRFRQTFTNLTDNQVYQLGELWLALDCYNEPRLTYKQKLNMSRIASLVLEALAVGYLELDMNDA